MFYKKSPWYANTGTMLKSPARYLFYKKVLSLEHPAFTRKQKQLTACPWGISSVCLQKVNTRLTNPIIFTISTL